MIIEVATFVGETILGLYQLLNGHSIEIGPNITVTLFTLVFWLPFTLGLIVAIWEATIGGAGEGAMDALFDNRGGDLGLSESEQADYAKMQLQQRRQRVAKWRTQRDADKVKVIYK